MGIFPLDVYRSVNIGIFVRTNDQYVLIPKGLAPTRISKLTKFLGVKAVSTSIAGSRLIGPLTAMNSRGILVSRLANDIEIEEIKTATGLPTMRLPSRYTSVGNVVAANDKGAIASEILDPSTLQQIRDVLDVPVERISIAGYTQVGSMIVLSNTGGVVHPRASDEEVREIGLILGVEVEPGTVNTGVPFVASGLLANSKSLVVGSLTSGPELMILSRAFRL